MGSKIEQISDLIKSSPTLIESSVVSVLNLIKFKKIFRLRLKSLSRLHVTPTAFLYRPTLSEGLMYASVRL